MPKTKDPSAPKRPLSGYLFFTKDERPKLVEANPGMKVTDVLKELGQRWKEVSEDDRTKYQTMADKDKERYNREMLSYVPPVTSSGDGEMKKSKKTKHPSDVKRPTTPFFFFSSSRRAGLKAENPGLAVTEVAKRMGEEWKAKTEDERRPFVEMYEKDKIRYMEEMAKKENAC